MSRSADHHMIVKHRIQNINQPVAIFRRKQQTSCKVRFPRYRYWTAPPCAASKSLCWEKSSLPYRGKINRVNVKTG